MTTNAPRGLRTLLALSVFAVASHSAFAQTYTPLPAGNTAPGDLWSLGTNWTAVPVSSTTTALIINPETAAVAATTSDDNAGAFQLNSLTFAVGGIAGSTITIANTGAGGSLDFTGTTPSIVLNANTAGANYIVSSNILLDANLGISGAGGANYNISGIIADGGSSNGITKTGTGVITFSGANTYSGVTAINGGTLKINAANNLGNASATNTISLGGGILDSTAGTYSLAANQAITQTAASTIQDDAGVLTIASTVNNGGFLLTLTGVGGTTVTGVVSGSGGLTKTAAGAVTLSNANTYSGVTTITGGTLNISAANNLGDASATNTITLSGGTLDSTANTYNLGTTRNVTLTANSTIKVDAGTLTVDGTITGTTSLTKTGVGTLVLSGVNTSYSGSTISSAGTLVVGNSQALGTGAIVFGAGTFQGLGTTALTFSNPVVDSAASKIIGGTAALTFNGLFSQVTSGGPTMTITDTAPVTFAGGIQLSNGTSNRNYAPTISAGSVVIVSGNVIQNPGGVTAGQLQGIAQAGAGTLILSGNNNFNGVMTVAAGGTLNIQSNGAMSGSGATVASTAVLQLQGNITTTNAIGLSIAGTGVGGKGALENVSGNNNYTGLLKLTAASTIGSDAGTLTLSNVGTITGATFGLTLTGAGNGSIASVIGTTTGGITKNGAGIWTLSGANTNTGNTAITAGTLDYAKETSLYSNTSTNWTAAKIAVSNGATLALQVGGTGTFTAADIAVLAPVAGTTTGGILGLDTTPGAFTYSNNLTTAGMGFTKLGTNTLTLSGANTYGGITTISGGVLSTGTTGVLNNGGSASSFIGTSSNAATNLILDSGTLQNASTGAASSTDRLFTLTQNGGTIDSSGTNPVTFAGNTASGPNAITMAGSGNRSFTLTGSNTGANTFAPIISDPSVGKTSLVKSGVGSWTLTGVNTFSGTTTVSSGTLNVSAAGGLGNTSAVTVSGSLLFNAAGSTASTTIGAAGAGTLTVNAGGTLSLVNNALNTLNVNNTTSSATALTLGGGTLAFDVGGASSDEIVLVGTLLQASVSGSNIIQLNIIGAGLNGTDQQLIAWGATPSGAGTFSLGSVTGSTGAFTLSLISNSSGLFLHESGVSSAYWKGPGPSWTTLSNFSVNADGSGGAPASLGATTAVTFNATGGTGSGATTLDADQTVSSLTFNVGGVVISSGSGGPHVLNIASASSGITVGGGLGAATETINSNIALGGNQTWSVGDASSILLINGNISGAGQGILVAGSGTLVFAGTNSYTGSTTVASGILSIQNAGALAGTSGVSVSAGGALQLAGGFTTSAATALTLNGAGASGAGALENVSGSNSYTGLVTLGSSASIGADTGTTLTLNNVGAGEGNNLTLVGGGNGSITGVLGTGAGSLIMSGTGTWTLSGVNTYTGGTTVNSGTLALSGLGNLGNANNTLTVNGGTLNLNGTNQAVGALNGSGGSILDNGGSNTLTVGSGNATGGSYAGSIANGTGAVAVTKTGTGTQTLTGSSSYTGATTINGGVLAVTSLANGGGNSSIGAATNAASNLVINGATLQYAGSTASSTNRGFTMTSSGATLDASGTGAGTVNFTGNLANSGTTGTQTLTLTGTGTGTSGAGTISGVIGNDVNGGTTAINKIGTGTWNLNGINTYSGSTTIAAGTLGFNNSSSFGTSSAVNLGTGTTAVTLNYTGAGATIATPLNINNSTGGTTLSNSGTGAVTYNGAVTIAAGSKTITLGNATDTLGGTINGNITNGSTGTIALTKTGAANSLWVLGGGNDTYTGTTTIAGGVLQTASGSDLAGSLVVLSSTNSFGIWQTNGTITRTIGTGAGQLNWASTSATVAGGFAAFGGTLTLNLNGGAQLTYTGNFGGNGGAGLAFGSSTANNQVILPNDINLNSTDAFQREITVVKGAGGDSVLFSGLLSNGAGTGAATGIAKAGKGTLVLSNSNSTFSGTTTIAAGTIVAAGNSAAPGLASTGVFGSGWGPSTGTSVNPAFASIHLGTNGGGNGNTIATGVSDNPTVLIGGAFNVARPIDVAWTFGTNNVYAVGGSTDSNATFSGLITMNGVAGTGNTFNVTQVATTGTNALNITGGITSTGVGAINFANVGTVNVSGVGISGVGAISVNQTGTGTTIFSAPNTYTGPTVVSAGRLLANAATGSSTGTGAVTIASGAALGGTGFIVSSTAVTNNGNFNLQDNTIGTLTVTDAAGVSFAGGAGKTLAFDAGAGVDSIVVNGGGAFTVGAGGNVISIDNINSGGAAVTPGTYTLIDYGTGSADASLYTLANNSLNGQQGMVLISSGSLLQLEIGAVVAPSSTTYSLSVSPTNTRAMVNSTSTITAKITNTGSPLANAQKLDYTGLNIAADAGTVTPGTLPKNGGPLGNGGGSDTGTATLNTTGLAAGTTVHLTTTVATATNDGDSTNASLDTSTGGTVQLVTNRTEQANGGTAVNLGRILVNSASSTAVAFSSAVNTDSSLTRTTLGASAIAGANLNATTGSLTAASVLAGTSYTFGGANDATNSTTRNVSITAGTTGTNTGTFTVTPTGEGLTGESVQPITVAYTATALTQRVVSPNASPVNIGTYHNGATLTGTAVATFTSTTGDHNSVTDVTLAQNGTADSHGVNVTGSGTTLFNGTTGSGTRNFTGTITGSGTVNGSVNVGVTTAETNTGAGDTYLPVVENYTANVYTGLATWAGNATPTGTWGIYGTGSFGTNWTSPGGTPGVDPDQVDFSSTDTATFGNVAGQATQNVTLDGAAPSLKNIAFNSVSTSYTISQGSGSTGIALNTPTGDSVTNSAGSHTIAVPISLTTSATINNTIAGARTTISGNISGVGRSLTINGPGTTVLSGNNSFDGGVTVNAGSLMANGVSSTGAGEVIVNSGGTLGGNGIIAPTAVGSGDSVLINPGGVLSPSNSLAGTSTLTLAFNPGTSLDLTTGSKLVFNLGPGGNDTINITNDGFLSLNGQQFSDFTFNALSGFAGNGTYILISTANPGEIFGSLDTNVTGTVAGAAAFLSIDANSQNLLLTVAAVPEPSTWALMIGGLVLLVVFQRQQRRKQS